MRFTNLVALCCFPFAILNSAPVRAEFKTPTCPDPKIPYEQSLIHFVSGGRELPSEAIGAEDPCDDFGGNQISTPRAHLVLYVNFNISGLIDVDLIDETFETYATQQSQEVQDWLRSVTLAVVPQKWMIEVEGGDYEAVLNRDGDTLFISDRMIREDRLAEVWKKFYAGRR